MEISLRRSKNLLNVLFDDDELVEKHLKGGLFRRRYGCSQGVTLNFEKSEKGFFLYIGFDRYKDPEVLTQITNGQSVEELRMLWELAHLPCAKIFGSNVQLLNGRSVELIDTVKFELRKVMEGLWASGESESEVDRRNRQMRLYGLRDGLPRIFSEKAPGMFVPGQTESPRGEVIFTNKRTETEPGTERNGISQAGEDSASQRALEAKEQQETAPERRFNPEKQPVALPTEAEPQVDAPIDPEKRDPSEIAECDGCKELFYERQLIEIKLGLYVCKSCADNMATLIGLGLTPDEIDSFAQLITCAWCGQPLTEVEPGRWLCPGCFLLRDD